MKTGYLIALLCFVVQLSIAQNFRPGYIKLKDGQDQHGLIGKTIPGYPESVEYKADSTSQVTRYYANDVSGYGIDKGVYYSSFKEPAASMGWIFAEIFVEGELTLIRRNGFFFLVDRAKNKVAHLNEKHRLKLRSMMLKGCPFVASQSMKVDRTLADLSAHVTAYNNCVAVKNPNYDGLRRQVSVGVMAGFDNSSASFDDFKKTTSKYLSGGKLADKSFLQAGIDITLRRPTLSNYLGLYTGLLYSTNSYEQSNKVVHDRVTINGPIKTEYNEYSIEFSQIKIPLGFEFMKPATSKLQPHVRVGMMFSKTLKLTSVRSTYDIDPRSDGNIYSQTPPKLNSFDVQPMFMIAAGLDYKVLNNHFVRFQLGYNTGKAVTNTGDGGERESSTGKFKSFSGMVGFIF